MQIGVQSFASRVPPRFDSKEAERTYLLQRLAAACRRNRLRNEPRTPHRAPLAVPG